MNFQDETFDFPLDINNFALLDDYLKFNAYFVTLLTLFGIIFNLISLTVFLFARGRNPIIGGIKYLFVLRYVFSFHIECIL